MQNLVKFRLCPVDSCNRNCKGQYIVSMNEFIGAYMDYKKENLEQACENVQENCACNDDAVDDQKCENQCYVDAGLDDCVEEEGQEEFEVERFMECDEMEAQNNNYRDYYYVNGVKVYRQFFIGLKCANKGRGVYLDVFTDGGCSNPAPSGTFEKYNYGYSLPYQKTSMIDQECIPCKEVRDDEDDRYQDDNYDDEQEVNLIELCEETYEQAGKCEKDLDIDYARNDECNFMKTTLLKYDTQTKTTSMGKIFAYIFFASTLGLAFMVYQLQQGKTPKISLAGEDHHAKSEPKQDRIETFHVDNAVPS